MKKSTKIICICAGACMGLGLLLMGIAKAAGAKDCVMISFENGIHFDSYDIGELAGTKKTYTAQDLGGIAGLKKLDISAAYGNIEVRSADEFKIECYSGKSDRTGYKVALENGELTLEMKEKGIMVMFGIWLLSSHMGDVVVWLPKDMELELIKGDAALGNISISANCDAVDLKTNMGNVQIDGRQKRVRAESSMGNIEWKLPAAYTTSMLRGSAETSLGEITCGWEEMGNKVRLYGENPQVEFDIEASMGDVDILFTK